MTMEHRRPRCLGCQATCSADEGYRTTTGWIAVCDACLTERRAAWMRTKQARIEAVERVEGLRP